MALMHEEKWSTASHEGWAVEKIIVDYANDQIKQVWKKVAANGTPTSDPVEETPPPTDAEDKSSDEKPSEGEKTMKSGKKQKT